MGDQEGLHELFRSEYPGLVRLAFLLCGNSDSAEEVTQEAFVRAAERWRRISGYDRPGAWLRLVVVRLAVRRRRRAGTETDLERLPERGAMDPPPPDPELYDALRELTETQRRCIVLHHLEDLPVTEVAELLAVPEATGRSHLYRGRQAMSTRLDTQTVVPR